MISSPFFVYIDIAFSLLFAMLVIASEFYERGNLAVFYRIVL